MAEYEIPCEECGTIIIAQRRDKRFCSQACMSRTRYRRTMGRKLASLREDMICQFCGNLFTPSRIDARYCSASCAKKGYSRDNREVLAERRRGYKQNPEKRQATLRRFTENHPDYGKERYARLKANPERLEAAKERQREHYLDNRAEYIQRAKHQRILQPTKSYDYRHGTNWENLFEELWDNQQGCCYLCGDNLNLDGYRKIHLDHDHRCCPKGKSCEKCRRGLACSQCNIAIGHAKDDPDRLRRIADNLEKVQKKMGFESINP